MSEDRLERRQRQAGPGSNPEVTSVGGGRQWTRLGFERLRDGQDAKRQNVCADRPFPLDIACDHGCAAGSPVSLPLTYLVPSACNDRFDDIGRHGCVSVAMATVSFDGRDHSPLGIRGLIHI